MARDVFISYCVEDKEIANRLCSFLERNEIHAWMAPRDVRPGQDWPSAIAEGIGRSHVLLVILSSNLRRSSRPFVAGEVSMAAERGLGIIAFRSDNVQPPTNIELFLRNKQWIDAFGWHFDHAASAVAEAIRSSPGFPARRTIGLTEPGPVNSEKQSRRRIIKFSFILKLSLGGLLFALLLAGFIYYRAVIIPKQQTQEAYEKAREAAAHGDYNAAISNFSRVIELNPTDAQAFAERGQAYLNLGKRDLAGSDVDRAIQLAPTANPGMHLVVADTLQRLDEYKRAVEQYDLYLASKPNDPGRVERAQRARGDVIDKLNARAVAERWLTELDSDSPPGNWITILPRRRRELGVITRREFIGCEKRADGNLKCSFTAASDVTRAVEIVVLKMASPGNWQVDGYGWK